MSNNAIVTGIGLFITHSKPLTRDDFEKLVDRSLNKPMALIGFGEAGEGAMERMRMSLEYKRNRDAIYIYCDSIQHATDDDIRTNIPIGEPLSDIHGNVLKIEGEALKSVLDNNMLDYFV